MKKILLLSIISLILSTSNSHATFSIIAYDPVTGEIGSAGASCIAGSIILSDILPGIGGYTPRHIGIPPTSNMPVNLC